MKPTIGRTVIYKCSQEEEKQNNHQPTAPAVITAVWSDTIVNLQVIADGPSTFWKTSVPFGNDEINWSWPEIVTAE